MLEARPAEDAEAEGEVEEAFVGDGEDDEGGGELEEDDDESLEVVLVGVTGVR